MVCDECFGTGYRLRRSYPGNERLPYPCQACGGTGITSCCEGALGSSTETPGEPVMEKTCSICGQLYTGYGHNAEPLDSERCCDSCNDLVIAKRLGRHLTDTEQAVMHRALRRSVMPV